MRDPGGWAALQVPAGPARQRVFPAIAFEHPKKARINQTFAHKLRSRAFEVDFSRPFGLLVFDRMDDGDERYRLAHCAAGRGEGDDAQCARNCEMMRAEDSRSRSQPAIALDAQVRRITEIHRVSRGNLR